MGLDDLLFLLVMILVNDVCCLIYPINYVNVASITVYSSRLYTSVTTTILPKTELKSKLNETIKKSSQFLRSF